MSLTVGLDRPVAAAISARDLGPSSRRVRRTRAVFIRRTRDVVVGTARCGLPSGCPLARSLAVAMASLLAPAAKIIDLALTYWLVFLTVSHLYRLLQARSPAAANAPPKARRSRTCRSGGDRKSTRL